MTCYHFNGIEVKSTRYPYLGNPSVCCPKDCGDNCNECNGNESLHPEYCSVFKGNMCYQSTKNVQYQCCAASIGPEKYCNLKTQPPVVAPCRLSKHYGIIITVC